MSQVTELLPYLQHHSDCVLRGHWMEAAEKHCDCGLAAILSMSSASPPVEQSEDCGCLSDHVEGCPMGPNYDPGFEWSPPPVTVSVEEPTDDEVIDLINVVTDLAEVDALDKAYPEVFTRLKKLITRVKEGHSLSTVSGVVPK